MNPTPPPPSRCPLLPPDVIAPIDCPLVGKPRMRDRLSTVETLTVVLGVMFWVRAVVYEAEIHGVKDQTVDGWLCICSGAAFFFCLFLTWLDIRRRHH